MELIKIMPCLDMKNGRVVKGVHFVDLKEAGYDLEYTKAISSAVTVPVVASGGAGTLEHFYEGVEKGGAQILLTASVFHFRTFRIQEVKQYLRDKGLEVNL